MNSFLAGLNRGNSRTWNDAVSNATSGNACLDYFGKCGSYRNRSESEVFADMARIFGENEELALKIVFYNRMITRKARGFVNTEKVQKGQGNRDEFVKSLKWLSINRPQLLRENLWLVAEVGNWKDLWYDSAATGYYWYAPFEIVVDVIRYAMENDFHVQLLAKYLPAIKSRSNLIGKSGNIVPRRVRQTNFARRLAKALEWSEKDYRQFKSNPDFTAHEFQRLMCARRWDSVDFDHIPGKALFNLMNRTGKDGKSTIERHGLEEKLLNYLVEKGEARFTGYVYELYKAAGNVRNSVQRELLDMQFETLMRNTDADAPLIKRGVLCALDTSGSMESTIQGDLRAIDVCVSLGIFFSKYLQGPFTDSVILFDDTSKLFTFSGGFVDRVQQIERQATAWGSTNFQSVIDEIVRVRKQNPDLPVEEFPEVLLIVSDMQFNPSGGWGYYAGNKLAEKTNYEEAVRKLESVGLPPMTIIWWQVNGRHTEDFPSTMDDEGTILISGFDPSIIDNLLGGAEEVVDKETGVARLKIDPLKAMLNALNQELLSQLSV